MAKKSFCNSKQISKSRTGLRIRKSLCVPLANPCIPPTAGRSRINSEHCPGNKSNFPKRNRLDRSESFLPIPSFLRGGEQKGLVGEEGNNGGRDAEVRQLDVFWSTAFSSTGERGGELSRSKQEGRLSGSWAVAIHRGGILTATHRLRNLYSRGGVRKWFKTP